MEGTDVPDADVIGHDYEDVGLLGLRFRGTSQTEQCNRQEQNGQTRLIQIGSYQVFLTGLLGWRKSENQFSKRRQKEIWHGVSTATGLDFVG
jgi:hypothetical protein